MPLIIQYGREAVDRAGIFVLGYPGTWAHLGGELYVIEKELVLHTKDYID